MNAPASLPMLGVLGGGQLGRMFVHAAQAQGFGVMVLEPDPASPAGAAANVHLCAPYDDPAALDELASRCLAVTTEFENVPAQALERLAQRTRVAPGAAAVRICQDRALEKAHFVASGVPCAPYARVETPEQAAHAPKELFPALLKTARLGYDGKGQASVAHAAELPAAWARLGGVPCVLEHQLPLAQELSVLVARSAAGQAVQAVNLPVQQNLHRQGILAVTQVPAPDIPPALSEQAVAAALRLAHGMNYVGVLCVEFFVLEDGRLVANEMAPRPHNSGHWSLDGSDLSQFDLQVRTLVGWPLVAPRAHSASVMLNLLGDVWPASASGHGTAPDWAPILALPGAQLHLYGKLQARPGRKMGHLNFTAPTLAQARQQALLAARHLGIEPF